MSDSLQMNKYWIQYCSLPQSILVVVVKTKGFYFQSQNVKN